MMDFSYFNYFASAGIFGHARLVCNIFHIILRVVKDFLNFRDC